MKPILALAALTAISLTQAQAQTAAPNSQLCLTQLELLEDGDKLTDDEKAVFEAQCACLEQQEQGGTDDAASCAQEE